MHEPTKTRITVGGKYGPFDIRANGQHWQVVRRETGEVVDDELLTLKAAFQLAQNAQAMERLFGPKDA